MGTILDQIIATKRAEIERAKQRGYIPLRPVGGSFIGETQGSAQLGASGEERGN